MDTIRNFSIIAHIDHGKSTLADRMLELTETVAPHRMREQVLDGMELERERGITIKMTPARMVWRNTEGEEYTLNLIDTPGHIDFSYEVSRALKAVEGTILLVDATQGVQAQTIATLAVARELGLVIIPVITKIDAQNAEVDDVTGELVELIGCSRDDIFHVSGKTGEGVEALLNALVKKVPPPQPTVEDGRVQGLIFDFAYSEHRGVILYARIFSGSIAAGDKLTLCATNTQLSPIEVGVFSPRPVRTDTLGAGEVGYIVTGIKEPDVAKVGDTLTGTQHPASSLEGYKEPSPVVWASIYPENQDDFVSLRQALGRLKLTDSSLSFEEETSTVMGRGFQCGFLGMLHLEIITERIRREYNLDIVVTTPTVTYEVEFSDGRVENIKSPAAFPGPEERVTVREPWVTMEVITPAAYMGQAMQLLYEHEAIIDATETFGDGRTRLATRMPLRELMRGFFDTIKSVTSGFASLSYEVGEMAPADVVRLDVLIAEELVPAFSRIVARHRVQEEAESAVERLEGLMPRQLVAIKIQGQALGRIVASRKLPALKKNVTGHLYGGDVTRKRKLWEKQKKGKKKMQERGSVRIPQDVYLKMMRKDS